MLPGLQVDMESLKVVDGMLMVARLITVPHLLNGEGLWMLQNQVEPHLFAVLLLLIVALTMVRAGVLQLCATIHQVQIVARISQARRVTYNAAMCPVTVSHAQ